MLEGEENKITNVSLDEINSEWDQMLQKKAIWSVQMWHSTSLTSLTS